MEPKQKISLGGGLFLGIYAGIAVFLLAILSVDFFRDENVIFDDKNWLNGFLTFPTVLVGQLQLLQLSELHQVKSSIISTWRRTAAKQGWPHHLPCCR